MQTGASVVYEEARAINVTLAPRKINYIDNPSFEVDDSLWDITGATFSQSTDVPVEGYAGSSSGQFVAVGSWSITVDSQIPLEPGTYFNASMYSKSSDLTSMDMFVDIYDNTDTLIDSFTDTHPVTDMWMRHYVSGLIGSDSNASYAVVRFEGGPGTFLMDMIQAEDTEFPTDYFDGSMPTQVGAVWLAGANASHSLYYPSKETKIRRLAQTITDWIPMNAFWTISTPAGLEYTNLDV